MKCPNCQCDDETMLEVEFEDKRTKELVVFCQCCSKIFRVEVKDVQKTESR